MVPRPKSEPSEPPAARAARGGITFVDDGASDAEDLGEYMNDADVDTARKPPADSPGLKESIVPPCPVAPSSLWPDSWAATGRRSAPRKATEAARRRRTRASTTPGTDSTPGVPVCRTSPSTSTARVDLVPAREDLRARRLRAQQRRGLHRRRRHPPAAALLGRDAEHRQRRPLPRQAQRRQPELQVLRLPQALPLPGLRRVPAGRPSAAATSQSAASRRSVCSTASGT